MLQTKLITDTPPKVIAIQRKVFCFLESVQERNGGAGTRCLEHDSGPCCRCKSSVACWACGHLRPPHSTAQDKHVAQVGIAHEAWVTCYPSSRHSPGVQSYILLSKDVATR